MYNSNLLRYSRPVKPGASVSVRNNMGLTEDQLRNCPSIFAQEQHESRSTRYSYINTMSVLNSLKSEGFLPVAAYQSGTRIEGKDAYTKHMIRLRRPEHMGNNDVDTQELTLINSHDGTSSYQLMLGIYRQVCSNGLIACCVNDEYKVYHKGDIQGDIIEAAYEIINQSGEVMEKVSEMKSIQLSTPERLLLSEFAIKAKYGGEEQIYTPEQIIQPRRSYDKGADLWTTYNVVQENIIKGGQHVRDKNYKRKTSRAVNSIDGNVKINKLLWEFSNRMMEIKNTNIA